MIRIGSLFSGIGGFELGLERAIPGAETIWQVEQNAFCQKVLAKHWPNAKIYNDVKNITADKVEAVDILCGGFPCQDISLAGKGEGLHGKKSGLWWEMLRIISELRPRIVVLENVAAVLFRGGCEVVGSLAEIGYCTEWTIISARDLGAPHLRRRWFAVAYPDSIGARQDRNRQEQNRSQKRNQSKILYKKRNSYTEELITSCSLGIAPDSDSASCERGGISFGIQKKFSDSNMSFSTDSDRRKKQSLHSEQAHRKTCEMYQYSDRTNRRSSTAWSKGSTVSALCRVDDGIPDRIHRLRALGNAIVPQCSEWVGQQIVKSGLLEDLI